jgi:hypothetical protein
MYHSTSSPRTSRRADASLPRCMWTRRLRLSSFVVSRATTKIMLQVSNHEVRGCKRPSVAVPSVRCNNKNQRYQIDEDSQADQGRGYEGK